MNQRWRAGRDRYRPAGEPIATHLYEVAAIADDSTPKAFVVAHHYSRSYPAARRRFGLFRGAELAGVAVFSQPVHNGVITSCLPGTAAESLELGRFVLVDDVPGNGETWFLGRCFEALRAEGFIGVVSFADPCPRTAIDGSVVLPGHVGTIYQAHNAVYVGRGDARTLKLLPDGRSFNHRAEQKIRQRERGFRHAAAVLERAGAAPLDDGDDAAAWLAAWLPRLTRPLKHRGAHKYIWALDRRARRHLPVGRPYPKTIDARAA